VSQLKAYTYDVLKQELPGCQILPSGTLRLDNTIKTENPDEADVFIFPVATMYYREPHQIAQVQDLKYLKGREKRHVFFDVSDYDQVFGMECLFIRCNTKQAMKKYDPNTISWAWPVEPLAHLAPVPEGGFKYDVCFHGWINYAPRKLSVQSCRDHPGLKGDYSENVEFHGYFERDNPPEAAKRVARFKKGLNESRISLCGRSIKEVFPYRFFEAMSAGRIPALFCTDYTLPWANKIDYEKCCLLFKEEEASNAGNLIRAFLDKTPDKEIIERGLYGMEMWKRWLCRDDWAKLMTEAVEEKFLEFGFSPREG
jgi:hypothetical protein